MGMRSGSMCKIFYMNNGSVVGIGLGNGGCSEHQVSEVEVRGMLQTWNNGCADTPIKARKFKKHQQRVGATYAQNIVHPNMNYIRRHVTINNNEYSKDTVLQTENGEYELFALGNDYSIHCLRQTFGRKRIFKEGDFTYMGDYQFMHSSRLETINAPGKGMLTSWDCGWVCSGPKGTIYNGSILILVADRYAKYVVDPLERNLKSGTLLVSTGTYWHVEQPRILGINLIFGDMIPIPGM